MSTSTGIKMTQDTRESISAYTIIPVPHEVKQRHTGADGADMRWIYVPTKETFNTFQHALVGLV
jgi:hypothetical protein